MMNNALVCLLLTLACAVDAETIKGKVVSVADGDTITLLDADKAQHKIRVAGIDALEKKQAFGNRSKESLSDMVFDKTVSVETEKRDRYPIRECQRHVIQIEGRKHVNAKSCCQ